MRILDKSNALLRLTDLGFLPENMRRYEQSYRKPYGTILVTGPTGSGKSTTLYATLNIVNDESKNVITVEDPVEYRLPNINQVQVNVKAGLTFAAALRSILRSDPDIVLVGEIRDRETANIAIEAALTGHLVLTTLHTNDAASTPMRLIEMGVEPFLVGSAMDCIVAQRLARRLCDKCKERFQPTRAELATVGWDIEAEGGEIPIIYRPDRMRQVQPHRVLRPLRHPRGACRSPRRSSGCIVERGQSEDSEEAGRGRGDVDLAPVGPAHGAVGQHVDRGNPSCHRLSPGSGLRAADPGG